MDKIKVQVINLSAIKEAEKMMVCAARLTQRGEKINTMEDFNNLYDAPYSDNLLKTLADLPHPTIQKFGVINVVVTGASRRFLAQITRHQNEVKFMSASLQYSDYSDNNAFCIPYEIIKHGQLATDIYLNNCKYAMRAYKNLSSVEMIGNDAAGYVAPQGLRNVLIISATPYQWKHMIRQRSCRRNTKETQYILTSIWKNLYEAAPVLFGDCGPFCTRGKCEEGKMCCGNVMKKGITPDEILKEDFPLIYGKEK